MAAPSCSAEVAVVGAGPAGCAAAIHLARMGHDVLLIDRGVPGAPAGIESAPVQLPGLLHGLGGGDRWQDAGLGSPVAAEVHWPGMQGAGALGSACLVDRPRLDRVLQRAACRAGARWLAPVRARAPHRCDDGRWSVPLDDGTRVVADSVMMATGGGADRAADRPRTVAWCGLWTGARPGAPGTAVEAMPDGWAWAAAPGDGRVAAVLFTDAAEAAGLSHAERDRRYRVGLARAAGLAALLGRAGSPLTLRMADATPRASDPVGGPGLWRIGEAALRLDPLSAQGLTAALRSGLQAAIAVHTARHRPHDAPLAERFVREQQARDRDRHDGWSAAACAQAHRCFGTPFWSGRGPGEALAAPAARTAPTSMAWPALDTRVMLDGRARVAPRPMVDGGWIVNAQALLHPGLEAPVGFVDGRPVSMLLREAPAGAALGEVLLRWRDLLGASAAVALAQHWWRAGALVPWLPAGVAAPQAR